MDRRRKSLAILVHVIRVSVVAALLLLIPPPRIDRPDLDGRDNPPNIEFVKRVLPDAGEIEIAPDRNGLWTVNDASGTAIARIARTLPEAADVIGYRGHSEAMIVIDDQLNLIGVELIDSADTDEHVDAVKRDSDFFLQFRNWTWSGPKAGAKIDAVSGATLTSLALAKGVLKRIGGDRPSLVFPDEVSIDEVRSWFPDAKTTRIENELIAVLDGEGRTLGNVMRTGPLSDSIVGYQGPTELLIRLDTQTSDANDVDAVSQKPTLLIADIKLRSSFDNQPYVRYCKTEYGFWALFEGKSTRELASMDLNAEKVEGVSGATMTSMAIAETLVAATDEFESRAEARLKSESETTSTWDEIRTAVTSLAELRPSAADWGCVVILCLIPLFRSKGWFRAKWRRRMWLIAVIGVIGIWSGNLISMALVAGWSGGGVAWRLAPALAAIAAVAFVCPVFGKSNPYCSHLCPHGAIQQLVRPTKKNRRLWKPPPHLVAVLKYVPGLCLVLAYVALIRLPTTDLSSWEPFHAYLFRIAPWSAISVAVATILFSAFVPMGYCRLGCPTGRLLEHLRRNASSDRLQLADGVSITLLVFAIGSSTIG